MSEAYRVIVTPEAQRDIRDIVLYIARELGAPQTALHLEQSLRAEIKTLAKMPKRIKTVDEQSWKDAGIRRTLVKKYYVYFIVDDEAGSVKVIAVIYVGRDQARQLTERHPPIQ